MKNISSALFILNDPIMRITLRFFTPLNRNPYYFERDMNEMLETELAQNEYTKNFISFVNVFFVLYFYMF